jgi:hypothetical protein
LQTNWVWVPDWIDAPTKGEAARLVIFRCSLAVERPEDLTPEALIRLSADTRYKLLINGRRVCVGPTRGSDRLWYYDTVDVRPFLRQGINELRIKVLRYFPGVDAGIPFARTAKPGLTVLGTVAGQDLSTGSGKGMWSCQVQGQVYYTSKSKQDIFLHVSMFDRYLDRLPLTVVTHVRRTRLSSRALTTVPGSMSSGTS